jgi:hypothetical protein
MTLSEIDIGAAEAGRFQVYESLGSRGTWARARAYAKSANQSLSSLCAIAMRGFLDRIGAPQDGERESSAVDFAERAREIAPRLGPETITKLADLHAQLLEQYESQVHSVEVVGARVGVDEIRYPNGVVAVLDAASNLIRVEFSEPVILDCWGR